VILPAGWDLHETGGNPDSAQLLETRRNGVLETARIFGIVPAELLLAELGGSSLTYQNIAGMLDTFMRVTGQPEYLSPIEEGLSDLLPRTQAVRFSLTELFRLSEPELIDTAVKALGAGIYTLPEVRRSLGRAPASNADPGIPPALRPTPPVPEEVPVNAV
jgi:phage portal protein BeeE